MLFNMHKLSIAFLWFLSVSGQRDPTISFASKDIITSIGSTVTLTCTVQFLEGKPLKWIKMEPVRIEVADKSNAALSRFVVRQETGSSSYHLQINDIRATDDGPYQCQVPLSTTNVISRTINVRVRYPPVIYDNSSRSETADEGQRIELGCYASGNPRPNITWRRSENALLPTGTPIHRGNKLVINKVLKKHRGIYFCVADNAVDYGVKRNIFVEVNFAPVVYVYRPDVYQALRYPAMLSCDVESSPAAHVSWFKNNEQLKDNQFHSLSLILLGDYTVTSILLVKSVESGDYGNYTCRAENTYGSHSAQLVLHTEDNPVCPPACDVDSIPRLYSSTSGLSLWMSAPAVLVSLTMLKQTVWS